MSDLRVIVRSMGEFQRVFFECPDGHDMGSIPLDMLAKASEGRLFETECRHYAHKRQR